MTQYKLAYVCKDGAILTCKFESDHRLVRGRKDGTHQIPHPIHGDIYRKFHERAENPTKKALAHGGLSHTHYVENMETGYRLYGEYLASVR